MVNKRKKYNYGPFPELEIVHDYESGSSIPTLSKKYSLNKSRIRTIVVAAGKIRGHLEAAQKVDWLKVHPKGGNRPAFSQTWRENISKGKKRSFAENPKPESIRIKNGYEIYSGGPNSGRPVHVVIMEKTIGRPIRKGEEVHHVDVNRRNNSPDNLELMESKAEHMRCHALLRNDSRSRDKKGRYL